MSLKIIPFEPQYAPKFRDLNLAWLNAYFYVEPKDAQLLVNSESNIIDEGGYIFLGECNGKIVGCFSFSYRKNGIENLFMPSLY